MKDKSKKQEKDKIEKMVGKKAIRCRRCFMVDSYAPSQKKCFHCGAKIYEIDAV